MDPIIVCHNFDNGFVAVAYMPNGESQASWSFMLVITDMSVFD